MIDNTDLRIGNLFWDEDKTPCYFAGAWQRNDGWINRDSANNTYKDIQMYPIPLTTEILEKCGMKLEDNKVRYGIAFSTGSEWIMFSLMEHTDGFWLILDSFSAAINLGTLRYLHQLQNSFYSLTRKELEIKL